MWRQPAASSLPSYDDACVPTGSENASPKPVAPTPLLVVWGNARVAIRRHSEYAAAVAAVKHSHAMSALGGHSFHFKAAIPGCGDELYEISEDLWSEMVNTLPSVTIALNAPAVSLSSSKLEASPKSPSLDSTFPAAFNFSRDRIPASPGGLKESGAFFRRTAQLDTSLRIYIDTMTITRHTLAFDIDSPNMTVIELKNLIRGRLDVSPDGQRLVYEGRRLENRRKLREYGITNNASIDLFVERLIQ